MEMNDAATILSALAHEGRLSVFRLLARRAPEGVRPSEISEALELKANTLSVYLGALERAGLVHSQRQGRSVFYSVNLARMGGLIDFLAADCCRGRPDLCAPLTAREVTREAIIQSGLLSAERAEGLGMGRDKIILSAKVSQVQDLIAVYTEMAKRSDYALHLGLTEAGMGSKGIVASSAALAIVMQQGVGDTIRISLTPEPGGDRTLEVKVAQEILQADHPRQVFINAMFGPHDHPAIGITD